MMANALAKVRKVSRAMAQYSLREQAANLCKGCTMTKLGEYLRVGEAADFLGVSTWTLRYWDRTGKLMPVRHPLSGYRLYRREQLDEILRLAASSASVGGPAADHPETHRTPG